MGVYVDESMWKFGRMVMCHMLADTEDELHEMAEKLGLKRRWHQISKGGLSHYDISKSKRAKALELGAEEFKVLDYKHKSAILLRKVDR